MLSRRQFLMASATTAAATLLGGCTSRNRLPEERAITFEAPEVIAPNTQWQRYGEQLAKANVNTINLGIGQPGKLGFYWSDYPDSSASLVTESGTDYVEQALLGLQPFFPEGYQLSLSIDVLIPEWISKDPTVAGMTTTGATSPTTASVTALTEGVVAEYLEKLVTELCSLYEPHRISLSQLMLSSATFGTDDLRSYTTTMGVGDWPRRNDGSIDESHASIGQWRSTALARLLARLKSEAHRFNDTQLDVEVLSNWEEHANGIVTVGHDYGLLLTGADRIIVSNYFGLHEESPDTGGKIATSLSKKYPGKFTMCTGMWGLGNMTVISPAELESSLRSVAHAGATSVGVTPVGKLTPAHWAALETAWDEE